MSAQMQSHSQSLKTRSNQWGYKIFIYLISSERLSKNKYPKLTFINQILNEQFGGVRLSPFVTLKHPFVLIVISCSTSFTTCLFLLLFGIRFSSSVSCCQLFFKWQFICNINIVIIMYASPVRRLFCFTSIGILILFAHFWQAFCSHCAMGKDLRQCAEWWGHENVNECKWLDAD